jgi:hypothetical protein
MTNKVAIHVKRAIQTFVERLAERETVDNA